MKNGKIQCAVLGCGNIGNSHAKAILANSELVDFAGVCDEIPQRAHDYQARYGAARIYSTLEEMLKDPDLDIIHICTPSGYHAGHAVACAKAGKNILCEKPLDITAKNINDMIEAFSGTKLKAGAVFQYRTYPGVREAFRMLRANELGRVLVANACYQQYRSPEYYKSAGWRGTWAIDGGGSTMNQGIHILDILCHLAGGARSVMAKAQTQARAIEVEDVSCAVMTFGSGAVGTYQATTLANPPICIRADILCEGGRLSFSDPDVTLYTPEHPEGVILGEKADEKSSGAADPLDIGIRGHAYLVRNLARAVLGEEKVFVPLEQGRNAVDTILALYESSRTGKEVFID